MAAIFTKYLDASFIDYLAGFAPLVGAGLILGLIFAVLGWVFGLVWTLHRAGL